MVGILYNIDPTPFLIGFDPMVVVRIFCVVSSFIISILLYPIYVMGIPIYIHQPLFTNGHDPMYILQYICQYLLSCDNIEYIGLYSYVTIYIIGSMEAWEMETMDIINIYSKPKHIGHNKLVLLRDGVAYTNDGGISKYALRGAKIVFLQCGGNNDNAYYTPINSIIQAQC